MPCEQTERQKFTRYFQNRKLVIANRQKILIHHKLSINKFSALKQWIGVLYWCCENNPSRAVAFYYIVHYTDKYRINELKTSRMEAVPK